MDRFGPWQLLANSLFNFDVVKIVSYVSVVEHDSDPGTLEGSALWLQSYRPKTCYNVTGLHSGNHKMQRDSSCPPGLKKPTATSSLHSSSHIAIITGDGRATVSGAIS